MSGQEAVDCGTVVNPLGVEAQISGGLQFGPSAALYEAISIERGCAKEGNFDSYTLLRLPASPLTAVQLLPSRAAPSGVGEIAVPPVAPALANALAQLTGRRIRKLPIRRQPCLRHVHWAEAPTRDRAAMFDSYKPRPRDRR